MERNFYGIDASLTSTGVAAFVDGVWDCATITSKPNGSSPGDFLDRVDDITGRTVAWLNPVNRDVIAIEAPAFHAKGKALDRMFYLFWAMVKAVREHHGEPWIIPPSALKKIATGNGNAGKDEMIIACTKRIPDAPVHNNNEVDAVWLAVAASIQEGNPIIELPKNHTARLREHTW